MSAPALRAALGLLLVGVVVFPSAAVRGRAPACRGAVAASGSAGASVGGSDGRCPVREAVLWSRPLRGLGSWVAQTGVEGTVPSLGEAYAAVGGGVAVIGVGLTASAFNASDGLPAWTTTLTGVPLGSAIVSVRAWTGVVTVGVSGQTGTSRTEFVLDAVTGSVIRTYRAAESGGAVSAGIRRTVVIGPSAVASYSDLTGRAVWRDPIGSAQQAWRVDGGDLYVTVSSQGEIGTAPVTAIRQISLRTGAQELIQPLAGAFDGMLTAAVDGVLVFSSAGGLNLYSARTGRLTGVRAGAVYEGFDPVQQVLYVEVGGGLLGIDPVTGQDEPGTKVPGPPGTYGVRDGIELGLDSGAGGDAWGYDVAKRHVIWTTAPLPWPHYFVDLSGVGGSSDPATGAVLLATCPRTGGAVESGGLAGVTGVVCLRPRLTEIGP
jgi:hypothetical protein